MKIAKRVLILYVAGFIAMAVHFYLFGEEPDLVPKDLAFFLFPAIVLLMGLLLGWFGFMIIQHSKWIRSFYLAGLNFSFVLLLGFLMYTHFVHWHHAKRYGYDREGISLLEDGEGDGHKEIVDGFQQLQRSFSNLHQVHLRGWLADDRLSDDQGEKDTIRTIFYDYFLGKNKSELRISRLELRKKQFKIVAFNQLPASDTLYLRLRKEYLDWRATRIDTLLSILKSVKH
jgi:hypothetical protein